MPITKRRPGRYFVVPENWANMERYQALNRRASLWLLLQCNTWARQNRTDGFIPEQAIPSIAAAVRTRDPRPIIADLLQAGALRPTEGGYVITGYLDWQRSNEEDEAVSDLRADAGRRGGLRSGEARARANRVQREANSEANCFADGIQTARENEAVIDERRLDTYLTPISPSAAASDADARADDYERRVAEAQRAHDEAYRPVTNDDDDNNRPF
jgi:hypothetical protein